MNVMIDAPKLEVGAGKRQHMAKLYVRPSGVRIERSFSFNLPDASESELLLPGARIENNIGPAAQ